MKAKVVKSFYVGQHSGQTGSIIEIEDQEAFEDLLKKGYIEKSEHMEVEVECKKAKASKKE
jgi:hypothetical protein